MLLISITVSQLDPALNRNYSGYMQQIAHRLSMMIATGFGSGFSPRAPGTAGTVVGVAIVLIWDFFALPHFFVFAGALFLAGWWACLRWSQYRKQTDCQEIVVDEILGYFVALGFFAHTPWVLAIQFVLFRIIDAWKPWPIRAFDRWGKGFPIGPFQAFMVIADDLLAGLLALGLLKLLHQSDVIQSLLVHAPV